MLRLELIYVDKRGPSVLTMEFHLLSINASVSGHVSEGLVVNKNILILHIYLFLSMMKYGALLVTQHSSGASFGCRLGNSPIWKRINANEYVGLEKQIGSQSVHGIYVFCKLCNYCFETLWYRMKWNDLIEVCISQNNIYEINFTRIQKHNAVHVLYGYVY